MTKVVYMADVHPIKPKSESYTHMNQRYTCTFDPNAPPHQQWVWQVDFVRTYKFFGSAPSLDGAQSRACMRIKQMTDRTHTAEENE